MTSYFCIPVPYDEKDIFFWVLVLKGLEAFIEPFNVSFFSTTGQGIDLDYCDTECFALETEIILSFFEIASKFCISDSFVDYDHYSHFFEGILAHNS